MSGHHDGKEVIGSAQRSMDELALTSMVLQMQALGVVDGSLETLPGCMAELTRAYNEQSDADDGSWQAMRCPWVSTDRRHLDKPAGSFVKSCPIQRTVVAKQRRDCFEACLFDRDSQNPRLTTSCSLATELPVLATGLKDPVDCRGLGWLIPASGDWFCVQKMMKPLQF